MIKFFILKTIYLRFAWATTGRFGGGARGKTRSARTFPKTCA